MLSVTLPSVAAAALLAVLLYWLCWRWRHRRMLQLAALMPGPPTLPVLGNALIFMTKPEAQLQTITAFLQKYGHYVRIWLGPDLNVCVMNPDDIRLLLTSGKLNLKGPLYKYMAAFIGPGILTGGPTWRNNRKMVNHSFSRKCLQNFTKVFNSEAEIFAEALARKDPSANFDVYFDTVKCTTLSVCQTVMGLTAKESRDVKRMDELILDSHSMYMFIFENMTHWWFQIPIIYWLCGRKAMERHMLKLVDDTASDILSKRRKTLKEKTVDEDSVCVVDRLLSGGLTDQEVKWEIFTLFTASQEASAKIASAVLMILAYSSEWQDKVYNEILEVLGPHTNYVTEDQLAQLRNLDLVYKEAVRMMPIGAFIQRTVEEEITINNGKITLPAGASVIIPIHDLHRDPRHWRDPHKARPERFLPEHSKDRNPNAYIPFSLGAMDCLGRVYSTSMIKTMVVHALRRVELQADGRFEDLELNVAISVKFAKGYNLRARPRVQCDT